MAHDWMPAARSLVLTAVLTAPAAAVLLALAAGGALNPWLAGAGALAVFLGLVLPVGRHLRHLRSLCDRLLQGPASGELPKFPLVPELDRAVLDAESRWQIRQGELEAALAGAEALFASLPDPVLMLDGEQRIVRANPAAEALLQEPLRGRTLSGLLRHPLLLAAVDAALADGTGRKVEMALPVPVEHQLIAHIEPVPRGLPETSGAILVLHDITALKRADQMRADFIANASHELRTPLSTLIGFLETLVGPARQDADASARFLPIMLEQARRMARLVSDLLSLSQIELHEHTAPTGRVDLASVLHGVANALEIKAKDRGMAIRIEAGSLPPVLGDADELAQVFQNLIDNAVKYGARDTEVRVVAGPAEAASPKAPRRLAQGLAVSVIDRGEGIPREHLPRLTERFYRVDSARSRELGGTGLGLAIVKHIVNRHRGHLEIESAPGEGSRFTVYLRSAPERSQTAAASN
ncbi:MAG TPA: ATP-binding protein [Alphaproteobacteria bacterium]|nr:ATP-binding protein [Alphaproteobacteria bacterium]